jgi:hypothetical protein
MVVGKGCAKDQKMVLSKVEKMAARMVGVWDN